MQFTSHTVTVQSSLNKEKVFPVRHMHITNMGKSTEIHITHKCHAWGGGGEAKRVRKHQCRSEKNPKKTSTYYAW